MRIIRFVSGSKTYLGEPIDAGSARRLDGSLFEKLSSTSDILKIDKLLSPLVPVDILCIGLNYRQHAIESKSELPQKPLLFIKAGNTLNNPGDPIILPKNSTQPDFEAELAVVIGKPARHVPRGRALNYVLGYTIANDVTARDWQREKSLGGGQFARGKSFDTFCPLGPWIVTREEIPQPNKLNLKLMLNGQIMQDHTTSDMIFDIPSIIESLSSTMTLRPGSVILTGTPQGVGMGRTPPVWLRPGDQVAIEIEKIGLLENPVIAEP